jgi:hypothetical protein
MFFKLNIISDTWVTNEKGFITPPPSSLPHFPVLKKNGNKISTKCSFSKLAPEGNEIWSRKRDRKQPNPEPDPGNGTGAEPRRKPPLDLRPGSDAHRPGDNLFNQNKLECLSLVCFTVCFYSQMLVLPGNILPRTLRGIEVSECFEPDKLERLFLANFFQNSQNSRIAPNVY